MVLRNFSLGDMLRCGVDIRRATADAPSMEASARVLVRYLYDTLRAGDGDEPACALLRCFVTLPYGSLPPELQAAARASAAGAELADGTRCLVLLATAGLRDAWNDRRTSAGHRAIPLPSPEAIEKAPMISRMVHEMGIDLGALGEGADATERAGRTYDVFFVPDALGSEHIPAQDDFVRPLGVRSVLGFGGLLQEEFFVVILFSREPIPQETASRFRNIALDARIALLAHEQRVVLDAEAAQQPAGGG